MADIPSNVQKIQIEETAYRSAVSEATFTKVGGTLNGVVDQFNTFEESIIIPFSAFPTRLETTGTIYPTGVSTNFTAPFDLIIRGVVVRGVLRPEVLGATGTITFTFDFGGLLSTPFQATPTLSGGSNYFYPFTGNITQYGTYFDGTPTNSPTLPATTLASGANVGLSYSLSSSLSSGGAILDYCEVTILVARDL
jgi:hypothetical protein